MKKKDGLDILYLEFGNYILYDFNVCNKGIYYFVAREFTYWKTQSYI